MTRLARWSVTLAAIAGTFAGCLWMARAASFDWLPHDENNRWALAIAFASAVSGLVCAAAISWAGSRPPPAESGSAAAASGPARTVRQRARVSGRSRSNQVAGNQYAGAVPPAADVAGGEAEIPDNVDQRLRASGEADVNQVAGDQTIRGPRDDGR
ncbi:hypothetical protein [Streptomyces sp. NRRL F-4474]|uniref:hypothetical protein n=1 Tax=Streptomyces sp. NRRL F-4474 TaxID=1463851 RepID=UPI0004C6995C|nr:hypothetical protein [Streptomyces sp. NRRL F-4474]